MVGNGEKNRRKEVGGDKLGSVKTRLGADQLLENAWEE